MKKLTYIISAVLLLAFASGVNAGSCWDDKPDITDCRVLAEQGYALAQHTLGGSMIFNYIRVSIILQNTERQLLGVDCDRTYEDKASGKDTNREQFQLMMSNLRPGDIVNVHSLDRVGRNTKDILSLVETIKEIGATIVFHKENLTFDGSKSDLYSDLMLTILSGFAQFERNIILERQREGIAIAKANGKYLGRAKKLTDEQLTELKQDFESGMAKTKIADKYNVTRSYVYQLAKQVAA